MLPDGRTMGQVAGGGNVRRGGNIYVTEGMGMGVCIFQMSSTFLACKKGEGEMAIDGILSRAVLLNLSVYLAILSTSYNLLLIE